MTDAHLVTQIRNRPAILRAGLVEGKDFTTIDSEAAARPAYLLANLLRGGMGKGWTTATAPGRVCLPILRTSGLEEIRLAHSRW